MVLTIVYNAVISRYNGAFLVGPGNFTPVPFAPSWGLYGGYKEGFSFSRFWYAFTSASG